MKSGVANGWRGIFALALLTGGAPTRAQAPPGTPVTGVEREEPKIAAIRIVKEDGQVLSDAPSGIAVETGNALDRGKIADSLRTLYRTGDYADLKAVVTPVADGVRLDFVVRENLFFNQVRIEGLTAPPSGPRRRPRCSSLLGKRTARLPSTKRWSGCERRFVKRACIRQKSPRKRSGTRRRIRWTLLYT